MRTRSCCGLSGAAEAVVSFNALRFAARGPSAERKGRLFPLPSAYPFSAQARLGPRWGSCGRAYGAGFVNDAQDAVAHAWHFRVKSAGAKAQSK